MVSTDNRRIQMADAIRVDSADPAKTCSEILGPTSDEATVQMSELTQKCYWNDVEFRLGARIIAGNDCYECSFGKWIKLDD
jgi:hypothetical protein